MLDHPVQKRNHRPQQKHENREHIVESLLIIIRERAIESRNQSKAECQLKHQNQNEYDFDLVLFIEDECSHVAYDYGRVSKDGHIQVVVTDGDDHGRKHQQSGKGPWTYGNHQSQNEKEFKVRKIANCYQVTNSDRAPIRYDKFHQEGFKRKLKLIPLNTIVLGYFRGTYFPDNLLGLGMMGFTFL